MLLSGFSCNFTENNNLFSHTSRSKTNSEHLFQVQGKTSNLEYFVNVFKKGKIVIIQKLSYSNSTKKNKRDQMSHQ